MTSEYLLSRFPFLAEKAGWTTFVEQFDRPECVNRRLAVVKDSTPPPTGSATTREMLKSAYEIYWPDLLSAGFGVETIEPDPLASARKLALMVISLLSDSPEGKKMRAALVTEGEHLDFKTPERNGLDAMQCLFRFVEREKKLPTKEELNIECQHWHRAKSILSNKEMPYGKQIEDGQIFRVLSCCSDSKIDRNGDLKTCYYMVLTGDSTWGKVRWMPSDYSKTLRLFGLSGLPNKPGRKRNT